VTEGTFTVDKNDVMHITELPLHKWTSDYKQMLESFALNGEVESIQENHKDNQINFVVKVPGLYNKFISNRDEVVQKFKMQSKLSLNNMVLFD
jgi:DNA topoisomerase-2